MPLGPLEIILIIVVIALLFGARKLPELGKGLGQGIREFKKETNTSGTNTSGTAATTQAEIQNVPSQQLDSVTGRGVVHEPVASNPSEKRA